MIEQRKWDSNFFGYPVGYQFIKSLENFSVNQLLEDSRNFKVTYVFSNFKLPKIKGLDLIEKKVTWEKDCVANDNCFEIKEFDLKTHSFDEILELAILSGTYSRFRKDTNFNKNEFNRLYKEWIEKSISHQIAEKVYVSLIGNRMAGFITLGRVNLETSQIGLISVRQIYQGQKIATNLINKVLNYAVEKEYKRIEVVTQMDNLPAMALYEKSNFRIKSIQFVYHLWN